MKKYITHSGFSPDSAGFLKSSVQIRMTYRISKFGCNYFCKMFLWRNMARYFLNSLFFYIKSVHYFLLFSKFNFSKFRNMYCFFKIFTICFILNLLILQTCLHFVFLLVKMQKNIYILFYFSYTHNAYTYVLCRLDWLYLKFKSLRKFEFEVTMFEQYSGGLSVVCSTTRVV